MTWPGAPIDKIAALPQIYNEFHELYMRNTLEEVLEINTYVNVYAYIYDEYPLLMLCT